MGDNNDDNNNNDSNKKKKVLFDKYEMEELLGQGTFAKVYHGKKIATGESVAIKVITKAQVKTEDMMHQIKTEISTMHLIHHPNVVELKEVMATKLKIYAVMEYVDGGELFARVARGKLKEDLARKYFQQLISAVDYCHSRGVYHRDLKPENLLLDHNEDLKISDFGLSALPEQRRQDGLLHTQCGTPAYIAPEVLSSRGYDGAKADIWSSGVILYVLLAGFLPFQDENVTEMYRKISKAEYGFPLWITYEAMRLISRMLVADPEKRITISGIMKVPWFRRNFSRGNAFFVEESMLDKFEEDEEEYEYEDQQLLPITKQVVAGRTTPTTGRMRKSPSSPAFLNAFQLISSMSSGLHLSSMFDEKAKTSGSMFTSRCSSSVIVSNIEKAARRFNFKIAKLRDHKVRMLGPTEGRKGRLLVTAEVLKVAPDLAVVEFSKSSGDTLEYAKFCEEDIRPALKDIVWTWQGDSVSPGPGDSDGAVKTGSER